MTQTIGYYCDSCRRKYVRHVCKHQKLPCGHTFAHALRVYAKRYAHLGEAVSIGDCGFMLRYQPHVPELAIVPGGRYFWDTAAQLDDGEDLPLGRLLKRKGAKFTRAFQARWESCQHPPDWTLLFRFEPQTMEQVTGASRDGSC